MGVCNCSMFCCTLLFVHSRIAIILIVKRELVALLNLSSWCIVMVEWIFLAVPWGCLRFVIVIFPDDTHLLFVTLLTVMDVFTYTISRADSVTVTARLRIILSTVMAMFTYTIS